MDVDTYRGIDNYVCWCHNSPLYVLYGKAKSLRQECNVVMEMDEIREMRFDPSLRESRWYVTKDKHLLENQAVWAPDVCPPNGFTQRQSEIDLTFFVHMYIKILSAKMLTSTRRVKGRAEYIDDTKRSIWLRRSLVQPFGLDSPTTHVNETHRFRANGQRREMYKYVRSWTGYSPLMVEVIKAEYDWLAVQADRDYNEAIMSVAGIKTGVVIP